MQQPSSGIIHGQPTDEIVLIDIVSSLSSPYFLRRVPSKAPLTAPLVIPEPQSGDPFDEALQDRHTKRRQWIQSSLARLQTEFKPHLPLRLSEQLQSTKINDPVLQPVNDTRDGEPDLLAFQENLGAAWVSYHDTDVQVDLVPTSLQAISLVDIYGSIHYNSLSDWMTLKVTIDKDYEYMIPPKSSFLLGPFTSTLPVFQAAFGKSSNTQRFDFMLLDPPWNNRSAKRAKHKDSYKTSTFNVYDLFKLNVADFLCDGGLVGIWLTNSTKWRTFLLEKLFPAWKVEMVAEWMWVKITVHGDPIFDLEHPVRKPYETLILARPIAATGPPGPALDNNNNNRPNLQDKIIFATPDIHSRKPCLKDIIKPYLPNSDPQCCEIFARNLTEGWFSWGNEVMRGNWRRFWT
ncbi:hypothetical protein TWF730_009628 [Orbilia blumenaviensis]|uniref:MT-A70-domain-containing protein n=1 Tax=Orbilia blumenaviensis TaxID=1796055 RepID=A0AAV9USM3_9PEZI